MTLVKFNPMKDLLDVEREFNRLFNVFRGRFDSDDSNAELENAVWMPLADIYEDNDNIKLKLDIPGVSKDDVKISYSDGMLSISGERMQESESKNSKYHRVERVYGKFYRSFTLPQKIREDKIEAEFKNGQLIVSIPKSEEAKPREISIKVN
jgi:HSP20 family protein